MAKIVVNRIPIHYNIFEYFYDFIAENVLPGNDSSFIENTVIIWLAWYSKTCMVKEDGTREITAACRHSTGLHGVTPCTTFGTKDYEKNKAEIVKWDALSKCLQHFSPNTDKRLLGARKSTKAAAHHITFWETVVNEPLHVQTEKLNFLRDKNYVLTHKCGCSDDYYCVRPDHIVIKPKNGENSNETDTHYHHVLRQEWKKSSTQNYPKLLITLATTLDELGII